MLLGIGIARECLGYCTFCPMIFLCYNYLPFGMYVHTYIRRLGRTIIIICMYYSKRFPAEAHRMGHPPFLVGPNSRIFTLIMYKYSKCTSMYIQYFSQVPCLYFPSPSPSGHPSTHTHTHNPQSRFSSKYHY